MFEIALSPLFIGLQSFYLQKTNKKLSEKIEQAPISVKINIDEKKRNFNTHKYIVKTATEVLLKDMKNSYLSNFDSRESRNKVLNFFEDNLREIYRGSIEPDICENDPILGIPTFEGHFYNPNTGMNYKGNTVPTAYSRFVEHAIKAKKMYEEKDNSFSNELGRAIHYLCDAGEPHHSSNKIAGLSNHLTFERYASIIKDSAKIKSGELYYSFQPENLHKDDNFESYCKRLISYTSRYSYNYGDVVGLPFVLKELKYDKTTNLREYKVDVKSNEDMVYLNKVVVKNIENSQNVTTAFLYNFFKAINI